MFDNCYFRIDDLKDQFKGLFHICKESGVIDQYSNYKNIRKRTFKNIVLLFKIWIVIHVLLSKMTRFNPSL